MTIRWVEADEYGDEYGNDNELPLGVIHRYGEATYYKLQVFLDGKWRDIPVEHNPLNPKEIEFGGIVHKIKER